MSGTSGSGPLRVVSIAVAAVALLTSCASTTRHATTVPAPKTSWRQVSDNQGLDIHKQCQGDVLVFKLRNVWAGDIDRYIKVPGAAECR